MDSQSLTKKLRGRLLDAVLGDGSLVPAFQPIIDLRCGRISSFEILARWTDNQLGIVNPSQFIPMIEQAGLLDQMTIRILHSACSAASSWPGEFRLAFNISPAQFADSSLPKQIECVATDTGFSVSRLQIEITEGAIFDDTDLIDKNISLFKGMGMRILLDDFGTGFSSLTRLQAIPFDKIKIDASFVKSINTKKSRMIVSSVIGLGQSLAMPVVAEGVETEQQLGVLRQLGCDYGQGYLFSRPVFAEDVPSLLSAFGQAPYESNPVEMSCSRRLAELNALYESNALAICFLDAETKMVSISRKFCEITGIDAYLATGRKIIDVFPRHQALLSETIDFIRNTQQIQEKKIAIMTSTGTHTLAMTPVRTDDGDIVGTSVILSLLPAEKVSCWRENGRQSEKIHLSHAKFVG